MKPRFPVAPLLSYFFDSDQWTEAVAVEVEIVITKALGCGKNQSYL